uniref:carboxypeptidase-like regulatory domain-containing protein n=1 Tax=uncultured Porphyromonas sp. TaxID=159274 RepID=UPI002623F963
MKKYLLRFFALMALCLCSPTLWAQVTTSSVNGTITEEANKEVLVGATVVAKHLPSGTTYGAVTNAKGNFSIVGMRPGGPYTLTISYIGFETITLRNIHLALGETETFNVKMKDGATQLTDVVVTGQKGSNFNLQKTGAGSSFSRRSIERVPSVSRSIYDIAKLTPQSNGNGSFAGANSRFNSFQIDGAVNNDVFGLG